MVSSPHPAYTVDLSSDGSYIHYRSLSSARTAGDMAERLRAATSLGQPNGVTRLLFDARGATFQAPIAAQYEYAYTQARQLGLTPNWRIALLVTPGDRSYDFMETALVNAGYTAQLFSDEEQAAAWLQGKRDPAPEPPKLPY